MKKRNRIRRARETINSRAERRKALSKQERRNKSGHYIPPMRSFIGKLVVHLGLLLSYLFLKVKYHNRKRIPRKLPYIIAANHVSFVDGMWIFNALPASHFRRTCAMVGADLNEEYGLLGKIIFKAARAIPVKRDGNAIRSLIIAKNTLLAGHSILIHPEGTRSHTGGLGPMQSGAAYIAMRSDVPILPVYIAGAEKIWPRGQKWPRSRDPKTREKLPLDLYFFEPLNPSDYESPEDMHAALEKVLHRAERKYHKKESF